MRGRIYCNSICPVGALLGLFSKMSLFRLEVDKSSCVSCGLCERNCKAQCIDAKGKSLDFSRCVLCFDCAANCPKKSISFKFSPAAKSGRNPAPTSSGGIPRARRPDGAELPAGMPRRSFGAALLSLGRDSALRRKKRRARGRKLR